MTVLEVIKRSAEFLAKKGVDSPRLQVELLLAHLLRVPRMKLYLDFERVLNPGELEDLRKMVQRRGQREPLQHIIGSTSFCGLEIAVNPQVLIPRPETELLAELGWQFLSAERGVRSAELGKGIAESANLREAPSCAGPTALDFGTGSGCLAIALAMKCAAANVVALDISTEALAMAQRNAAAHKVESRIRFLCGDGFSALPPGEQFDLIVSNPPYIPSGDVAALQPEVLHDPRLALDGGADGLDFYRRLAMEGGPFVKPDGRIMLELGDGQAVAVKEMFESQMWIVEPIKADYIGTPRFLVARRTK